MSDAWVAAGVKCVCVGMRAAGELRQHGIAFPAKGEVCTIRDVTCDSEGVFVRLVEYRNPEMKWIDGVYEPLFFVGRFRPLVSRTQEQDLAIFRPILTSISVGEDA